VATPSPPATPAPPLFYLGAHLCLFHEMGRAGSSYSSDDERGRSELSDEDDSFEASLHYGGPVDTRLRPRYVIEYRILHFTV